MHADPAVMEHLRGVRDEAGNAAYLARNLQHWTDYGFGLWILRELGGGPPVGRTVLRHLLVEGVDEVEVGYAFYPAYWGKGFATEIAAACLALGREKLHLKTIVAVTSLRNAASQHVLRKVGLAYPRRRRSISRSSPRRGAPSWSGCARWCGGACRRATWKRCAPA